MYLEQILGITISNGLSSSMDLHINYLTELLYHPKSGNMITDPHFPETAETEKVT